MTERAQLERRYQRLLLAYPREYRQATSQELIWVLLASAADRQRWPTLADAADLVGCGLAERLRAWRRPAARSNWRDGLALFSVAAPLTLLLSALMQELMLLISGALQGFWSVDWAGSVAIYAGLAVATFVGRRGTALVLLGLSAGYSFWLIETVQRHATVPQPTGLHAFWLFLSSPLGQLHLWFWLLEAIALTYSSGLWRGRQLLNRPAAIGVVMIGALLGVFLDKYWTGQYGLSVAGLVLLLAALAVLARSSRPGRQVAALMVLMLCPYVLTYQALQPQAVLTFAPEAALACLTVAAVLRARRAPDATSQLRPPGAGD
jgi:hypothetical protein